MNGACAIAATEATLRMNWMSGGERPNSMSPIRNVYGVPPKVPYSVSYTLLKKCDWSKPGARLKSRSISRRLQLKTRTFSEEDSSLS